MTPQEAQSLIVRPVLAWLGPPYNSREAELLLLAIGVQESGFQTRLQHGGPAHGFWQFEHGGGCARFASDAHLDHFRGAADALGFSPEAAYTYDVLGKGADELACLMARALLWTDHAPLPALGQVDAAYAYYVDCWAPGKPSRVRWRSSYATAQGLVTV